jgi:glycosyltransferase involved in cell wall biosynthesis
LKTISEEFEVVILMPIYKPDINFLLRQIESINSQQFENFVCILGFDGPIDGTITSALRETLDPVRFRICGYPHQTGVYLHIERLLSDFASLGRFVALCDQDDRWHTTKISNQVNVLLTTEYSMVTDNALLVDLDGKSFDLTLFEVLGISNSVKKFVLTTNFATGAGSMYRKEMVLMALPFPKNHGNALHDHWLVSVAEASNGCLINETPSWEYRQHGNNLVGAFGGNKKSSPIKTAFTKFHRIWFGKDNSFERQIIENIEALKKINPNLNPSLFEPTKVFTPLEKLRLLSLSNLRDSRLDVLRVIRGRYKTTPDEKFLP